MEADFSWLRHIPGEWFPSLTLYGHIKKPQQWTIIQEYSDSYTGHWWVGCYVNSEEGPGWAAVSSSLYQI